MTKMFIRRSRWSFGIDIVQVELIKQPHAAFSGLARLYSLTWTV